MATKELTADRLRELLHYDPETGVFRWRVKSKHSKRAKADKVAGSNGPNYTKITLDRVQHLAHRLAWLYVHGAWPIHDIDHRNGVRTDNRLANLRDVMRSINIQNQRQPMPNGTSGFLGASWCNQTKKWRARILANGVYKHLGRFKTQEQAHAAYLEAKRILHEGCTI